MYENNFTKALYDTLTPEYDNLFHNSVEGHVFSDEFEKKMEKLIKRRKKPYYRIINTVGKRVACAVFAFLVASSVTVLSVKALREAVADFFINIYEKFSTIQSADKTGTAPETIEDIYEITYDLSGFTIDYEDYNEYSRNISYVNDDISIDFQQYTKEMYDENVNTEGANISTIIINSYEAIYFRDNHQYDCMIWDNGDYIIALHSNIGKDALIEIAESVQIVEK